ncbi:hypothetical protein [Actinoalloteichus sp. GBA129-24]|nr:hypothetical protein [Actinoalloteichus sp. GBA129-24]
MAKKDDGGLFPEPCRHTSTRQTEHEIICTACGEVVGTAPHLGAKP